ncbi:MAG: hypothetical protein VX834_01490 [Myxococcota bacterium]|nr:hypothetical protein [Myxococcota bacterium]
MNRLHSLAPLLAILVLAGCAMPENLAMNMECSTNEDCADGQACFFAKCVESGDALSDVYIDLTPAAYSSYVAHMDPQSPRNLSSGASQQITIDSAVETSFTVETASGLTRKGILTATFRDPDAPATLPSSNVTYRAPIGDDGTTMALRQGHYDISFEPEGEDSIRPPMTWLQVGAHAQTTTRLAYPEDVEMYPIQGKLAWVEYTPISGAVVQATGSSPESSLRSSEAAVQEDGSFQLLLASQVQAVELTVRGDEPESPLPTVRFSDVSPDNTTDLVVGHTLDYITAEFQVNDSAGQPVADASVQLEGQIWNDDISLAHHNIIVRTDATGYARAVILGGLYQVTVIPPRANAAGIWEASRCLGTVLLPEADCQDSDLVDIIQIVVPPKVRVSGVVRSASGEPLADTKVSFVPEKTWPRQVETVTDGQGRYAALVDPSSDQATRYRMVLEPPLAASAPMHQDRVWVGHDDFELDVRLPPATFINGAVVNAEGQAVANVGVSFYSTPASGNEPLQLIGYSVTNDAGEYVVALPLPDETQQ